MDFEAKKTAIYASSAAVLTLTTAIGGIGYLLLSRDIEQRHAQIETDARALSASFIGDTQNNMTSAVWKSWAESANPPTQMVVRCVQQQVPPGWDDAFIEFGQIRASAGSVSLDTNTLKHCFEKAYVDAAIEQSPTLKWSTVVRNGIAVTAFAIPGALVAVWGSGLEFVRAHAQSHPRPPGFKQI